MFGIALRRALLAIQRLNAHQFHQPRDVPAADAVAHRLEAVAQHARTRERVVRMQMIGAVHQFNVGRRDWNRNVVDRTAGKLEKIGLARKRKVVLTINNRFPFGPPTRPSAFSKKIAFQREQADLCVKLSTSTSSNFTLLPSNADTAFSRSWVFHCVM